MESPYKKVDYATLLGRTGEIEEKDEEAKKEEDSIPIVEYPSVMYETHEEAYKNDDVIKIYTVIEEATGDLCIELVSERLTRIDYVRLKFQDRTSPEYAKELEDESFLRYHAELFDRAIHKERLISEN